MTEIVTGSAPGIDEVVDCEYRVLDRDDGCRSEIVSKAVGPYDGRKKESLVLEMLGGLADRVEASVVKSPDGEAYVISKGIAGLLTDDPLIAKSLAVFAYFPVKGLADAMSFRKKTA